MEFKNLEKITNNFDVDDLGPESLKELQAILGSLGYYKGDIDGILGNGTRSALAAFKSASYLEFPTLLGKTTIEALFDAYDAANKKDDSPFSPSSGTISIIGLNHKINLSDPIIPGGHFTWNEATHGGTRLPQQSAHTQNMITLAKRLEDVREQLGGKPITITSWYRPEPFNRNAGGARFSQHLGGAAVDIKMPGESGRSMGRKLSDWNGGMGIYPHLQMILHIDIRGHRTRWGGAGS